MTTIRLLKNGSNAFPDMFEAMERANASISLEMYIVAPDAVGAGFRDRLAAAAKRGVQVRVLVDAWGSWNLPDSFWNELREAGGEVRWFHPITKGLLPFRNHRKLLLIDDQLAYIGGMNLAETYFKGANGALPWRDNMLAIEGPEAMFLRRSFLRMWRKAESPLKQLFVTFRRFGGRAMDLGGPVRFLESGPENLLRPVRRAYRRVVRHAVASIDLAMGYFYPDGRTIRALRRAVRRGVRVRLLLPLHTDIPLSRWAARGLYGRLLRAGVEVWEYQPAMMHAKVAIADDTLICGSANLDVRSGRINYELVAVVNDAELARDARRDFEEDLASSVRISIDTWRKRPILQKLMERISYCLLARFDIIVARRNLRHRP